MGANMERNNSIHDLWSNLMGIPIYKGIMSREYFEELLRIVRFDDKDMRTERKKRTSSQHSVKFSRK